MTSHIKKWVLTGAVFAACGASGGTLGVVNKADGTVSFLNVETGELKTVPVGHLPHEVAIGDGFAYVSNYGSAHVRSTDVRNRPGNTLTAVDLRAGFATSEIDLGPARCAPHGLAISKDRKWLYATCEGRHEIAAVDLQTRRLSHTIATNQAGSHLIVLSSDGKRAYVSNFWHGTVSVIDLEARALLAQIVTGRGSEGIGLSRDDRFVYVTRVEDDEIVKVDTATLKVAERRSVPAGTSPIRVWPSPVNPDQVLVNAVGSGNLLVLNAATLETVQEINVGRQPIGLAVSDTHHAFVANMKDNSVMKIDLGSGKIEGTYPVGAAPDGIAFHP